jgi:hypothetical protein
MIYKIVYENVYIDSYITAPGLYEGRIEDIILSMPYMEDYKVKFIPYPEAKTNIKYCSKETHVVKENLINFDKNIRVSSSEDFNVYKANYYNTYVICIKGHKIENYYYEKRLLET